MPTYTMLIGVPGSGKSTWLAKQPIDWINTVIASTDNIIARRAEDQGLTYSDVFQKEIKSATVEMNKLIQDALQEGLNVIHDQTNTSVKVRATKLAQIPDTYEKVAVFFPTPALDVLGARLNNRPGKQIPWNVVQGMANQLQMPTESEGFDRVIVVN
jgi:predicted kinase